MKTNPNLQPGALVLLREDNTTPLQWPTAVVTNVHPGKDGIVRVVTIRTPKGVFKRPITKFALYRVKVMTHSVSVSWGWQCVPTRENFVSLCLVILINACYLCRVTMLCNSFQRLARHMFARNLVTSYKHREASLCSKEKPSHLLGVSIVQEPRYCHIIATLW